MGGRMSRNKGARGERSLCLHLNLLGYDARRVIRTRAVRGYENDVVPDVIAVKDGAEYTFESKYRKNSYATIYKLYEKERYSGHVYRFSISDAGPYVAIGSDFEEVRKSRDVQFRQIQTEGDLKTHLRIVRLSELLKGAQFLCIKDNGFYPLFIRFWL